MTNDADKKRDVAAIFGNATDGYLDGDVHKQGADLERLVEWCGDATCALDIATGAGHVAGSLADRGHQTLSDGPSERGRSDDGVPRVIAADLSPEMLETATTEYPRVEGVAVDAERLPFPADRFDAITCRFAAHHFPDPEAFLAEVERVLAPGGVFAFEDLSVPDDPELAEVINRIERLRDPGHVETYSGAQWLDWCGDADLAVADVHRSSRRLEVDAWLDRMDVPADDRERIRTLLSDVPSDLERQFDFRYESENGDRLESYRTPVVLIRATK